MAVTRQKNANWTCDYCGLSFSGAGYSPDGAQHFCCYGCALVTRILGAQGDEGPASWILLRLGIGAFLAMNVMMLSLVLYTTRLEHSTMRGIQWGLLVLSTPAVAILGIAFIRGSWQQLRRGRLSMDALIATGSLAAYCGSAWHVIRQSGPIYFDTATMLLLIVTIGRLLEATAKNQTSRAIRDLTALTPETATLLRGKDEIIIPTAQIRIGDHLLVRPGERIPADSEILSGESLVEESAFTGESRPRHCCVGDHVYGGSLSCDGRLELRITAVGSDALLSQIELMVLHAQQKRAPIERTAERISTIFIPVVWLVALAAIAYWGWVRHDLVRGGFSALAIMVVACPCALGLATPMATCLAIGRAARGGVLIGSGEILECLSRVRRLFLDKTGTLTPNQLSLVDVRMVAGVLTPDEALSWAASLESGCNHAIARALVDEARARRLPLGRICEMRVVPGHGIIGTVELDGDTRRISIGTSKLTGASCDDGDESLTTVFLAMEGKALARFCLRDQVRPESRRAVAELGRQGIALSILSGDGEGPTHRLANELDISEAHCKQSPEDKLRAIAEAKAKCNGAVGMVGDGINDAPALAAADVGIAVGGGTDLARQASDVTLLGDDLTRIPWVLALSRKAYHIIRWNLAWAFGYNAFAITLAFFGFIHPLIAAGAMVISSLTVITNSLRLKGYPN